MFEKVSAKFIGKGDKFKAVSKIKDDIYKIPVVYAKFGDNGIMYWAREGDFETHDNIISIVYNGAIAAGKVYAHKEKTGILAESYFVRLKDYEVSFEINLFLQCVLEKALYERYSRENLATWTNKVENEKIILPVLPSCNENKFEIAFEYMESYIKELEAERLEELEAYLLATGLKDYKLTEQEKVILQDFAKLQDENSKRGAFSSLEDYLLYGGSLLDSKKQNFITHALSCLTQRALKSLDTSKWAEFRIGDLFSISTPKKKFDANKIQFGGIYPYVARGETNNGIRGYITQDTSFLNPANTISFGQDTATMFYQDKPYFTGDKIKIFSLKVAMLNRHRANFLIASMRKSFSTFSWGSTSFSVGNLQEVKVLLPVLPSPVIATAKPEAMQNRKNIDSHENSQEFSRNDKYNIDFAFMESFIKEIEKEHFLSLIEYYHKEMSAYNEVIDSSLATTNGGGH